MSFQGTKPSFNTPPKTAFQIKILILFEAFLCQKKRPDFVSDSL